MQGIEFQIVNDSAEASSGLDELAKSLANLKNSLGSGGSSLSTVAKNIKNISDAVSNLNTGKLDALGNALEGLKAKTDGLKISSSIGNQLKEIGTALNNIPDTTTQKLTALADGLRPLSELGKQQLGPFLNQLKKFPEIVAELDKVDMGKFADQMQQLAASMKPFADEMQKVSSGFAAFPSRIQRLITSTERYNGTVRNAETSTSRWSRALKTVSFAAVFKGTSSFLAKVINRANEYIESLNLFTVSMGDYAKQAYNYAQTVSEVMGIDPGTWMENQGVFNSIITGFGVVEDKAYTMSKNLTQLAYDISSFYNIGIEESMQKVQSGISGELEPLRRLGYDLSVARLQQEALNLGIEKSVSDMTQAEKAQLRYHAMLTQVTQVQGDMARTLQEPANQLRVLKAQVEQAARAFGNLFIPILNAVLPVAIAVASAIREIINAIAALFGIEMADSVDFGDSLSGAAGATGEIADDMDAAAGSAKKMKSYLMGFDELNVINPSEGSGSGAGSSGGTGFDIEPIDYDFLGEAVTERIDAIKAKLEPFVTWVKEHLEGILTVVGLIGAAFLAWKLSGPLMTALNTLKNGLNIALQLAGKLFGSSGPLTAAAASVGKFAAIAGTVAIIVARFIDLYNNSEKFRTGLERIGEIVKTVFDGIKTVLGDVWESLKQVGLNLLNLLPEPVKEGILGFFEKMQEWMGQLDLDWKDFAITIAGIAALFVPGGQLVGAALLGFEGISIGIRALGSVSDEEFNAMLETATNVFTGIWEFIKTALDGVIEFVTGAFTGNWEMAFNGISEIATGALNLIGTITEEIFGVNIVNVVSDWYEEHVKPWFSLETWQELGRNALDGLFNGLSNMWERAKTWGSDLLQNVKDILGIHSPSKEFEEIGKYAVAGMQQGFSDMSMVSGQFNEQLSVMRSYAESFSAATRDLAYTISSTFVTAMTEAKTAVLEGTNAMVSMFQNMAAQSAAAISSIVTASPNTSDGDVGGTGVNPSGISSSGASAAGGLAGSMFVNLQTVGENLVTGFVTGINNNLPMLTEKIAEMKESVELSFTEMCDGVYQTWDTCLTDMNSRFDTFRLLFMESLSSLSIQFQSRWASTWMAVMNVFIYRWNRILDSLQEGIDYAIDALNELIRDANSIAILTGRSYQYLQNITVKKVPVSYMADGGFPGTGQLFIAREAGAELVGSIGNRTAVVNNDQIVEAVSGGVRDANDEQNALLREQNELLRAILAKDTGVKLDGKTLLRSTEKAARQRGSLIMAGGVTG